MGRWLFASAALTFGLCGSAVFGFIAMALHRDWDRDCCHDSGAPVVERPVDCDCLLTRPIGVGVAGAYAALLLAVSAACGWIALGRCRASGEPAGDASRRLGLRARQFTISAAVFVAALIGFTALSWRRADEWTFRRGTGAGLKGIEWLLHSRAVSVVLVQALVIALALFHILIAGTCLIQVDDSDTDGDSDRVDRRRKRRRAD
jgi:hypothetical protein